jgi:hypothetical protein
VIADGEHLSGLAARQGFDPAAVWNDDRNRDLRAERAHPNVLAPGDVVFVPDAPPAPAALHHQQSNRYRADVPTVWLDLVLGAGGRPFANEAYRIEGAGDPITGTSDGDGKLSVEVPAHVREVRLIVPGQHSETRLRIGGLDPIDHDGGVASRLANLGYLVPPMDGDGASPEEAAEELAEALAEFQRDNGLEITREADAPTVDALARAHGS